MVKATEKQARKYYQRHQRHAPSQPWWRNGPVAFLVGGSITAVGQLVLDFYLGMGIANEDAINYTAATMIFVGALLTGLGIYDQLGTFAGMGAALPITGFANAVVSPALEFKQEGFVLGVGAKMFSIAGPVIIYGVTTSFLVGAVLYLTGG